MGAAIASAAVPAAYQAPPWIYLVSLAGGLGLYLSAVAATRHELWWLTGIVAFTGSYGAWAFARCIIDGRTPAQAFSPASQSWGLLWDIVFVILVMPAAYIHAHSLVNDNLKPRWKWEAYAIGLGFAVATQWFGDIPNYLAANAGVLLDDPAKIIHGLGIFPFLAALLLYLGWPIVRRRRYWNFRRYRGRAAVPYLLVLSVVIWSGLGNIHDAGRFGIHHLNLYQIQTPYNWAQDRPEPNYRPPAATAGPASIRELTGTDPGPRWSRAPAHGLISDEGFC